MTLLVDMALRATIVLAAAGIAAVALRHAPASLRHLVWTLGMLSVLVLPPLTAVLPEWRVIPALDTSQAISGFAPAWTTPAAGGLETTVSVADAGLDNASPPRWTFPARFGPVLVMALWGLGAGLLLLRAAIDVRTIRRLARHARPAEKRIRAMLADAADTAGVNRPVRLLTCADIAIPMTWGARRPLLLLPDDARGWSDERLRIVLLHELAHIRRADWLTHAMAQVVLACHWYNPLAWIAAGAMTRERERACDDFVVDAGTAPDTYAGHLLEIARAERQAPRVALAPAMARRSELEGRLMAILTPHRRQGGPLAATLVVLTAAVSAAAAASASTSFAQDQPTRPPAAPAPLLHLTGATNAADRAEARQQRAARQTLAKALDDPSERIREHAAMGLAMLADADVVPLLLRALKDSSGQVREKAAMGLAYRRQPEVLEALLAAAKDADAQVREKVILALGSYDDERAFAALTAAADDPDEQVREKAVQGLARAAARGKR